MKTARRRDDRLAARRSVGERSGEPEAASGPDGGRRLQERPGAEGHSRRSVHGHDGIFLSVARLELHRLPRRRKRRQLGEIRRRQRAEADDAPDDSDGDGHQPDEFRRTATGDVQHVSSRDASAERHAEPGAAVRRAAARRTWRSVPTSSRPADSGSGARQVRGRGRRTRSGCRRSPASSPRARTKATTTRTRASWRSSRGRRASEARWSTRCRATARRRTTATPAGLLRQKPRSPSRSLR